MEFSAIPIARPSTRALRLVALAGAALGLASPALAQTWTGLSATTNNWTDATNWTALPINNGTANVIFGGVNRLTPIVNISQDINSLTFNASAGTFTLGGAGTLSIRGGGITHNSPNVETFVMAMTLVSSQTWNVNAGALVVGGPGITMFAGTTLTLNIATSANINTALNGAAGLTKSGPGQALISIPATYSGATTLNDGAITLLSPNVLPDSSPMQIGASGILRLNNQSDTIPSLTGAIGSQVQLGSATLTVGTGGADASTYTFSGVISGTGNLAKANTHTLVLAGDNTYTGTTTVLNGTLRTAADERLSNSSILAVQTSGILDLQGFTETVLAINQTGGELGPFGGGGGTLNANAFNLEGGLCRLRLGGNGGLTKSNPAFNMVLASANNSFLGNTTVTGGTLVLNATNALPTTTNLTVNAPGILQVSSFPSTVSGFTGTGTVNIFGTTLTIGAGNASSIFSGIVDDDPGSLGNLTKIGTGTLTLTGANTFGGITTLNAGALLLSGSGRLGVSSSVVINAGQFITQSERVAAVTLNGGELRGNIVGVGSIGANTYAFNNGFCDAILTGPGGLVKGTPGLVSLGSTNNSPSFVRIDAGTLEAAAASALGQPEANVLLNGGTLRLTRSMTLPMNVAVGAASTIECLGDVTVPNFSVGLLSGGLSKIGPGRLILNGAAGTCTALGVNAGEVVLSNLSIPINGISVGAAGTLTVDGALLTLTSGFSNLGRVQLARNGRILCNSWGNNGVVSGSGTIAASFTNNATGDVRIGENEAIFFSGTGTFTNAGLFEVLGGTAEFAGPVTNSASTGLIYARDAALRFNANLTNFGGIALSFGVTDIFGDIDNRSGGVITISGASDATFVDDVINNGTLRTSTGAASVFLGALSGSGTFPGTGTVFMEGDLRPGNSPGRMTFGGDLIIGTFAAMQAEVAGTNPGTFDTIDVAGTVVLDGTLDVSFVRDFRPRGCDTLTIIHANAVVGSFHTVHLPNNAALIYQPDRVELLLSGCPADLDDGSATGTPDCGVTVDDLLYFIDGYTLGLLPVDLDDGSATGTPDGGVTIDDLLYYLDRYTGGC